MSLRDQLLKKGLVSKKRARKVDRELKQERKRDQGARQKKAIVKAQTEAEIAAVKSADKAARLARRLERDEAKAQVERALRIRNLMWGNRIQVRGPQPFWHPSADRRHLLRVQVTLNAAERLRRGELAIAAFDHGNRVEYLFIRSEAAKTLVELGAAAVVFFVTDPKGTLAPEEAFMNRTWESDLRPHRAQPASELTAPAKAPRTGA